MVLPSLFKQKKKQSSSSSSFRSNARDESFSIPSEATDTTVVSPLRQLLDAVNMSIFPHDLRIASITQATGFFDHRDRLTHDNELREGAANILYQKLAFALSISSPGVFYDASRYLAFGGGTMTSSSHATSHHHHEIALICNCLEMVHRASPDAIAATWYDVGEDALPILVRVLERPFLQLFHGSPYSHRYERQQRQAPPSRDLKLAVQKVTKLLAMYSLVPEAKYPIVHCPGMLTVLVKVIDTRHLNRVRISNSSPNNKNVRPPPTTGFNGVVGSASGTGLVMTEAARFNTIATLTNLAASQENRTTMLQTDGLVDNIARIVQTERSDVARQCSALALMNLSNGGGGGGRNNNNKDHSPEIIMTASELLLETLVLLLIQDDQHSSDTRRNAIVTLYNIACADENTTSIARYKNGILLDALLDIIVNTRRRKTRNHHHGGSAQQATTDNDHQHYQNDDESRAEAAETLFNMSCSESEETLDRMASHSGLLETLANVIVEEDNQEGQSVSIDVKLYCAATLRRMAEVIHSPMPSQGPLLTALVRASVWTRTTDIAEAVECHATTALENRLPMAQHHGLLNALARMAKQDDGGVVGVVRRPESEKIRQCAISAIEKLARDHNARSLVARNESIMMALTQASYGVDATVPGHESNPVQVALKHLVPAM